MIRFDDYDFKGKKALIRVDFNVPLNDKREVTDDNRIRAAAPTILKILKDGGSVVLMSHLGRPKDGPEEKYSLKHVIPVLEKHLNGTSVKFVDDCVNDDARKASSQLKAGEVLLLENLRFYKEETAGDEFFAGQLAEHGDCYVNDAFGTAHRAHASTTVVANFFPKDKMFGYLIEGEIESIDKVLHSKEKPVLAIIGGAKVSSKITILESLLPNVDHLIIGGGMAYTFVKAKGGTIGNSLVEDDYLETALSLLKKAEAKGVQIHLPSDTRIADDFREDASTDVCPTNAIPDGWMGLDIGPDTITAFVELITKCKIILWNGPMGVFEMDAFAKGTIDVANALVTATEKGAFTLVGGGDSVAAVNKYKLADKVSYVSTGGGAMLEYLEGIELPGIAAIRG
ncbi:MAG: phosphoglycerate kinase [Flavobacteriales bacterium]|nr:phosphoglycerate kinase [Flavobacteriales bacterium]